MTDQSPLRLAVLALLGSASIAMAQPATFTTLHSFTASPDGREPRGGLIPYKGALYGTTNVGGSVDSGTIYRVDPASGAETVLYDFAGSFGVSVDGNAPEGELVAQGACCTAPRRSVAPSTPARCSRSTRPPARNGWSTASAWATMARCPRPAWPPTAAFSTAPPRRAAAPGWAQCSRSTRRAHTRPSCTASRAATTAPSPSRR